MSQSPQFLSFQAAVRTFMKEGLGADESSRAFVLTETARSAEKLCHGLSCIDSGFRENTVEYTFRAMSKELYDFLAGPVSGAILKYYGEDEFWLIYRSKLKGVFEQVRAPEAAERLGSMCLVIFRGGHDWVYVNENSTVIYLSASLARRVNT